MALPELWQGRSKLPVIDTFANRPNAGAGTFGMHFKDSVTGDLYLCWLTSTSPDVFGWILLSTASVAPSSQIVWRPGGVLAPGVVTTSTELMAWFAGIAGPAVVAIDDSLGPTVFLADVYDFEGRVTFVPFTTATATPNALEITDGAQLVNVRSIDGCGTPFTVHCRGVAVSGLGFDAVAELAVTNGAIILADGAAPCIQQAPGDALAVTLDRNSGVSANFVNSPATANLAILAFDQSAVAAGAIVGAGTAILGYDASVRYQPQAGAPAFVSVGLQSGIMRGTLTLVGGTAPAPISVPGLTAGSTIRVGFRNPIPGAGSLTRSLCAPFASRVFAGEASTFLPQANVAAGTINVLDVSDVEWTVTL